MIALAAVLCFIIALYQHLNGSGDPTAWMLGGLLALALAVFFPWYPSGWRGPRA